jgi:hypothetical protein
MTKDWLLVTEVAERYDVSRSSVLQAFHAGNVRGVEIPRSSKNPMKHILIEPESARAWFEGRPRQGVGAALDRLQARVQELEDALRPFAEAAGDLSPNARDDEWIATVDDPHSPPNYMLRVDGEPLTVGHLRRAASTLAGKDG